MSSACCPYALKASPLSSHGKILQFADRMPRESRILDVGSATGFLGRELRSMGFESVAGLDLNPEWAETARSVYGQMVVCDLERDTLPWQGPHFDLMICGDVLEHLRDPWRALDRLRELLRPGGWMVVSVPNVAHWSVRICLLAGRFNYVESGILDRSHLRFFTRATARGLMDRAGLRIEKEEPVPLPFERWVQGRRLRPVVRAAERLDWILAKIAPSLFAYQILFVARVR